MTPTSPDPDPLAWFLEVYERLAPRLQLAALAILRDPDRARDAVQEAVVRVYARLDRLEQRAALPGYLLTAVRNAARDALRQSARRDERDVDPDRLPAPAAETADPDQLARLGQAVLCLPAPWQEALALRYGEGLNAAHVAERLGISHAAARARLSRAQRALRRELEEER